MIKTIGKIGGALCALAAFAPVAAAQESAHYVCADNTALTATFQTSPGSAVLVFAGSDEKTTLPQVMSADGGRYATGDVEFWIKGRDATLTRGDSKTTCKS
jgi:membrane-bound inhibitor of C-type lysozyme